MRDCTDAILSNGKTIGEGVMVYLIFNPYAAGDDVRQRAVHPCA
jgi:hypothetical protein